MSTQKRITFSAEFKAKIALAAVRGDKTINELSQDNNVHPTQITQWKKELLENVASLFEKKRGPAKADESKDPERLYSEIGKLKMELDWLQKKSGICR